MLILTRRTNEKIIINDDVIIEVLGQRGNQIRLGITAPKAVPVHREEIYNKINDEEKE